MAEQSQSTDPMSGDAIREAMARAMPASLQPIGQMACANAALATLPVTTAQLAEIAAGRAVVVPVEATEAMVAAGADCIDNNAYLTGSVYDAMIAAALGVDSANAR